ncbi:uncharacterized protein G2W53_032146 [Senna tora]|uniref:Uncharacterized protein n=1 Tax=Senna tora TaxID=362788 RepID=A0A834SYB8_9FABA|nr:uncharacterized protein G2W53_032146 [Senna tora]
MAAMPSNKTSSSSSSLAAPPSRSRNSEISNPMRRSFTGNPFQKPSVIANPRSFNPNTPANSPSDFPGRNSFGGRESAGSFRDLDDKENGKDQILKPAKVRSPAASTTKSTKNFMSPTISASSKIAESPRKKVLTERNEPARASFSSTDGKSSTRKVTFADFVEYSDSKPEIVQQENKFQPLSDEIIKEETEKLTASMVSEDFNGETESTFEPVTSEPDCVNLDPTFRLSPTPPPVSSTSTVIAPLDADPLIPPYDPKMNYLSPRPQFLHYRPNPRVELYKERECMKLEDSFSSDTEATEEALSDVSDKSDKESEDVSSNEMVSEEQVDFSEPSTTITESLTPEEGVAKPGFTESLAPEEEVAKPGFSMRSKSLIALLLLLSVASITFSVTNSPVFDPTALKDLTIFSRAYDSSEFSNFARANFDRFSESVKANFDELNQNLHIWLTKSMSSISELISTFRGEHTLGHLHYWNLTVLQEENIEVNQFPLFGHGENLIGEAPQVDLSALNNKKNDDSSETCTDEEEQQVREEEPVPSVSKLEENDAAKEIDTYEEGIEDISAYEEQEVQQDMEVITEVENASDAPESEEIVLESEAELSEPNDSESNIDYPEETSDRIPELFEATNLEAKQAPENDASVISEDAEMIHSDDQLDSNSEIHTEVNHDIQLKQGGNSASVEAVIAASLLLLLSIIAEQASLDKPFSLRNGPIVMDDVLGESCPSEMSSFQIQNSSSYYSQKVVKEDQSEAQSLEMKKPKKNNRRESLASSDYSMGSPSYGSFTTYEKLSSKHAHREAEVVTPVRRSSRIKNLATSPL